jgi:hypothetical protein
MWTATNIVNHQLQIKIDNHPRAIMGTTSYSWVDFTKVANFCKKRKLQNFDKKTHSTQGKKFNNK